MFGLRDEKQMEKNMHFSEILKKMQKTEKNAINQMYLNEIIMKWKKVEQVVENNLTKENVDLFAKSLTDFTKEMTNKKFRINKTGGFKSSSDLFSVKYIDDILSLIIEKHSITKEKGVYWGLQTFSMNSLPCPENIEILKKNKNFDKFKSPKLLQLVKRLDLQYRIVGTRVFAKQTLSIPIIIFYTYRNFHEESFIRIEHLAKLAKKTYPKAKTIVVAETIDKDLVSILKSTDLVSVFVLRRQYKSSKTNPISSSVINGLEQKILSIVNDSPKINYSEIETGIFD